MPISQRQLFLKHIATPAYLDKPIEIEKAKGIYMYGTDGREYIDLVSGVSVSNLGHGHPAIVKAVQQQAGNHMHLMVYGEFVQSPQVNFAKLLCENLPKQLQSVFYVNSGSEAIEGGLKLAKRVTGRSDIIAFKNAYHGSTHGALSVLGSESMKYAYRPLLPGIHFLEYANFEHLERINDKIAAVLIEPIQAEAGIIIPSMEYIKAVRKKCDETGTLLIFDEIQMGFGRTGKLFAFEHFDIVPDILCIAKAMGGGMPIGAFVSSKSNMDTLKHNPALGHITTFGGHPVSAAAAHKSLCVILEENLIHTADDKGRLFVSNLNPHKEITDIRQIGLMLGVELKDAKKAARLMDLFLDEGIIVDQFLFNQKSFRIAPPLNITVDEITKTCGIILACLDRLIV